MKHLNMEQIETLKSLEDSTEAGFLHKLIQLFQESGPQTFVQMKETLSKSEISILSTQAHKFKSSCFNLGATRLGEICLEIETKARLKQEANYADLISQLESEFPEVLKELQLALQD